MKKVLLCTFLTFCLVLSMIVVAPDTAYAEDNGSYTNVSGVYTIESVDLPVAAGSIDVKSSDNYSYQPKYDSGPVKLEIGGNVNRLFTTQSQEPMQANGQTHDGFWQAKEQFELEILRYIKGTEDMAAKNCFFAISGYSRGAAVANLLAGDIIGSTQLVGRVVSVGAAVVVIGLIIYSVIRRRQRKNNPSNPPRMQ